MKIGSLNGLNNNSSKSNGGIIDIEQATIYTEVPQNPTKQSEPIINVNGVIYMLVETKGEN